LNRWTAQSKKDALSGVSNDRFGYHFLTAPTFYRPDSTVIRKAIKHYEIGGDFADLLIVGQAKSHPAEKLFSFDSKLQNRFPGFVTEN
jgi:hypothetical protein